LESAQSTRWPGAHSSFHIHLFVAFPFRFSDRSIRVGLQLYAVKKIRLETDSDESNKKMLREVSLCMHTTAVSGATMAASTGP
jgi:hypothetical protein